MTGRLRSARPRRLVVFGAVVSAGVVGMAVAPVAAGAAATTSTTQAAVEIPGGGLSFRGAVITAPGKPTRTLSAYQSAAFVQGWIVEALYGRPKHEPIPADVTPYRVDVTGTWGGGSDYLSRAVFYASDGTQAWVVFPDPSKVPATGVPANLDWFRAPPAVIPAFAGKGKLVATATPTTAGAAGPATDSGPASSDDSGGSAWPWIVGVVAVVAVAGAGVGWRKRRARTT